jgi:hypothetical protein
MRSILSAVGLTVIAICCIGDCGAHSDETCGDANTPAALMKLDVCDISFLWPVPRNDEDVKSLVSAADEHPTTKEPLWAPTHFERLLELAESTDAAVKHPNGTTRKIALKPEIRDRKNWKVAGIRIDGGAPGGHSAIVKKFGAAPQLRVVLQPVTVVDGKTVVHDFAAHLVFNFVLEPKKAEKGFVPVNVADAAAFSPLLNDLLELKKSLKANGVDTAGARLGVHPGFTSAGKANEFKQKLSALLMAHAREKRLTAMAFMGLAPEPEPWIFVATARGEDGVFGIFRNPSVGFAAAQMLTARDRAPEVFPAPTPTNRNAITNFLLTKPDERRGVATAALFAPRLQLDDPAPFGRKSDGAVIFADSKEDLIRLRDIPDIVANPAISHFFNTDCVGCHTESTFRTKLNIGNGSQFLFKIPAGIAGVDPQVLPKEPWNVRNFGWFPSFFRKVTEPTVSQRTANETADAVDFINRVLLSKNKK